MVSWKKLGEPSLYRIYGRYIYIYHMIIWYIYASWALVLCVARFCLKVNSHIQRLPSRLARVLVIEVLVAQRVHLDAKDRALAAERKLQAEVAGPQGAQWLWEIYTGYRLPRWIMRCYSVLAKEISQLVRNWIQIAQKLRYELKFPHDSLWQMPECVLNVYGICTDKCPKYNTVL